MAPDDFTERLRTAERALKKADPVLGAHIRRVGPCTLARAARFRPFEALLSSIVHQQLNGKAALTILGRVKDRVGGGRVPTPEAVLQTRLPSLRACGLSRAKALAVRDLAAKTLDGTVPPSRALHRLGDGEIVARLTTIRGIGPWSVEMMLMFHLGRLDVMPVDDFGVRKGHARLYGLAALLAPKALLASSQPWAPYRSVAAWYFWRALDG